MRRKNPFRLAVVAVSAAVAASMLGAPSSAGTQASTSAPVADQVDAPVPDVDWRSCEWAARLRCATARVPLDYDRPGGATIRLSLLKDPANRPERRIGSLFVNPGGPGGSSVDFASQAGRAFGPRIRQRFDIVGIDPRGVGGTTNAVCKGPRRKHPMRPRVAFPFGHEQEKRWIKADTSDRSFCAKHHNQLFDHVSTADTARDMDLIRQALGDDRLTYYGISYGSYLGSTYAAMFPDRVRAMVVDGVLDPVAWSTGRGDSARSLGFSTRLRSGYGAYEALVSGLAECDRVGVTRCRAAGDVYGEWRTIVRKARNDKLVVGGDKVRYSDLVSSALGSLYSRSSYRYLAGYIHWLHRGSTATSGSRAQRRADERAARLGDRLHDIWRDRERRGLYGAGQQTPRAKRSINDPFASIACSDSANPTHPNAWIKASKRDDYTMPWFGRLWTWASSICSNWPGSSADAFRGPWKTETSTPLLVIGNAHDPATPITGARAVNRLFDGSRLLMLDGWGHGALGESECVTSRMARYLVSQRLPAAGMVCKPDRSLYPVRKH
ncbi:MAG: alpha/beta hydrolase [Nocardioidaceae bacterium]